MALELFFVSARTNKRHHHHLDYYSGFVFHWLLLCSFNQSNATVSFLSIIHSLQERGGVRTKTNSLCAGVNFNVTLFSFYCQVCQCSFPYGINASIHMSTSIFMAIYKLSWLFLRSLERGGVSELGLAQSADSFPALHLMQNERDIEIEL